ncbi:hypothetical protein [Viridibacillus arvi]|uniref:hypothetical protein n=1 Tax=Viridibacillus arvi TaxID=263475 RepID=UPI0034CE7D82
MVNNKLKLVKSATAFVIGAAVLTGSFAAAGSDTAFAKSSTSVKVSNGKLVYKSTGKVVKGYKTYNKALYKDGKKLTGLYKKTYYKAGKKATGTYKSVYYKAGKAFTGVTNKTYYKAGKKATGTYKNVYYKSGKAYTGVVNKTYYKAGKKATGLYKGVYYKTGKAATGIYKDQLYISGNLSKGLELYKEELYKDGSLNKGLVVFKDQLYKDAALNKGFAELDGKFYFDAALANDTYTVEGVERAFENGVEVGAKVKAVEAINGTQLKVTFNKGVDASSVINSDDELLANKVKVERTSTDTVTNVVATTDLAGYAAELSDNGRELTITVDSAAFFKGDYDVSVKGATVSEKQLENYYSKFSATDTAAPTVTSVSYKTTSDKFVVKLSEPVESLSGQVVTINGKPASFDAITAPTDVLTISRPVDVALGTTATIYVAGFSDNAGNKVTPATNQVTATKDDSALAVTSMKQVSNKVVRVTLNKKLSTASDADFKAKTGLVVTKDNGTTTNNFTVIAAPAAYNTDGNVYDITLSEADYATSNSYTSTITFVKEAFTDVTGNKNTLYSQTITLNKDVVAPTVQSTKLSADGKSIEVKFSEELNSTVTVGNVKLRKDGGEVSNVTAIIKPGTKDTLVVSTTAGIKLAAGSYQVRLEKGAVKDINLNDVETVNAPLVTVAASAADPLEAAVATVVGSNVITITAPVNEKFTTGSLATSNFAINGVTIPSSSDVKFTDTNNNVISITLPATDSVKFDGKALFTTTGLGLVSGNKLNQPSYTATLADNTLPVLQSAKVLDNKTIELTYDEAIQLTGANASVGDEFTIKQGSNTFTLAAGELKANIVSGYNNKIRLTIAQGADTVGTPAESASTFATATDLTATAGNTATGKATVTGTFNGSANTTLKVEKTATGYSVDGGATDVTLASNTFSYKGLTVDVSGVVSPNTGDSWTVDLVAAVAEVPGTTATVLDLTKTTTVTTKTPATADVKDKATVANAQKVDVTVTAN